MNMMRKIANALVGFVALEHLSFLVLEMFLWTTPTALRTFDMSREFALESSALAANQGLYNGFLAAGLIWGLFRKQDNFPIKAFFLSCIVVAAIFGAVTAKLSILYIQGAPAMLALILLSASRQKI